jgi:hypothetical protein
MGNVRDIGQVDFHSVHHARNVTAVEIAGMIDAVQAGIDQWVVVYGINFTLDDDSGKFQGFERRSSSLR